MASGQKITPDTLIIFDEIQACPEALNSLKYFWRNAGACSCIDGKSGHQRSRPCAFKYNNVIRERFRQARRTDGRTKNTAHLGFASVAACEGKQVVPVQRGKGRRKSEGV